MTVNSTEPYPTDPSLQTWADVGDVGINGRGVKRAGKTTTIGARSATSGEDVSSQDSELVKP